MLIAHGRGLGSCLTVCIACSAAPLLLGNNMFEVGCVNPKVSADVFKVSKVIWAAIV